MNSIFPPNPKEGDRLEISSKGLIYRNGQWNLEVLIPLITDVDTTPPNPEVPGDGGGTGDPSDPVSNVDFPSTTAEHWLPEFPQPVGQYTYSEDNDTYHQTATISDGQRGTETHVFSDTLMFVAGKKDSTSMGLPAAPKYISVSPNLPVTNHGNGPVNQIIVLTDSMVFAKVSGKSWNMNVTPQNAQFVLSGSNGSVNVVCTDKVVRLMDYDPEARELTAINPVTLSGDVTGLDKIMRMDNYGFFLQSDGTMGSLSVSSRDDTFTVNHFPGGKLPNTTAETTFYTTSTALFIDSNNTLYQLPYPGADLSALGEYADVELVNVLEGTSIDVNGVVTPTAYYFSNGEVVVGASNDDGFAVYQYPLAEGERIVDVSYGHSHNTLANPGEQTHVATIVTAEGTRIEEFSANFSNAPISGGR